MPRIGRNPAEAHSIMERQKKALAMRLAGATLREISDALGVDLSTISRDIQRALADIPREEADALRKIEVQRLDRLQRAVWTKALGGDLSAVDRAVKIVDRRAKLLGLDAPQKVEVAASDVDLDATVAKLLRVAELTGGEDHAGMES